MPVISFSCFTYMYAFACSWLSPPLACHTLHTPHLTQFCTAIAYLPYLLAAPFLLDTHFMHLVYFSFVACFFACHLCMLSPKYTPRPLHFGLSFACYSVALCLTLPLFTWLLYVNILWHKTTFAPQLRQPHLWNSALWLFAFLCHSSHAYFM